MDAPSMNSKRTVKPRKLLDPKKTSSAARALMAANARQSPLLRVSPEIRNRIYKLVLGGQALHIFPNGWTSSLEYRICTSPHVDEGTSNNSTGDLRSSWLEPDPHEHCRPSWDLVEGESHEKLDSSLLQVCKQIHEEAALLPFASNTFLLESISQLAWFSENLLSAQRSAVASVVLDRTWFTFEQRSLGRSQAEKARLRRPTGLKKLRVNIEIYYRSTPDLCPSIENLDFHLAHWLEVLPLRSIDCATVRFRAAGGAGREKDGLTQFVPGAYGDWSLEAEKALLQKPNK